MTTMKVLHPLGVFGLLLLFASALLAEEPQTAPGDTIAILQEPKLIELTPGDGMNLAIIENISTHYVVVKVTPPVHNWFAGTFKNLPTDKEVTIGLSMEGNDSPGSKGDVNKWQGLRPMMTYADPTQYATYEWFQKDEQGRWVSGDPFKQGEDKYAGTDRVPKQEVIPPKVAEQFLSKDGKYWQAWREVDGAEAISSLNIFRIKQQFSYPTAIIAMRVPYTYTYLQQFIERLKGAKLPGVFVDELGMTRDNRKIQVIRIEKQSSLSQRGKTKQAMLIYAREHPTEHSSSWVVEGVFRSLLATPVDAKQPDTDTTWLLMPIMDVDGSYHSLYDNLTTAYYFQQLAATPQDVVAIVKYLRSYLTNNGIIASAISFHGIECNEGPNVYSPFGINHDIYDIVDFNRLWFSRLAKHSITVGKAEPNADGFENHRLNGWCWSRYGAFALVFEINDRYPARRLSLKEIEAIGEDCPLCINEFMATDAGKQRMALIDQFLSNRRKRIDAYYRLHPNADRNTPGVYELVSQGF